MSMSAGVLALTGRGRLPELTLHGTTLLAHGLRTLQEAVTGPVVAVVDDDQRHRAAATLPSEVQLLDPQGWPTAELLTSETIVVHDPLCPLVPVGFMVELIALARANPGAAHAAFRPVTDTVKTVRESLIEGTIDREGLAAITAPVVLSARRLAVGDAPPADDFAHLVAWLRSRGPVELVKGPSLGRRVDDAGSVGLLECVDEVGRRVRAD